jgi:UPF0755 protein
MIPFRSLKSPLAINRQLSFQASIQEEGKVVRAIVVAVMVVVVAVAASFFVWLGQPLAMKPGTIDFSIEPGQTAREVATGVVQAGLEVNPTLLYLWFRLSGQSRQIKAGSYELDGEITPKSLLRKIVRGEEAMRSFTILEGWTFQQIRDAIRKADHLKLQTSDWTARQIMEKLGKPDVSPEGRLFPDTYNYAKGSSDLALIQRAMRAMDRKLEAAWQLRDAQSPLRTPEQLLVLASIIEKETGLPSDRPMVSAVFSNRLRSGMRLQTDPSVIFGLGSAFNGNLRKIDLLTDNPWNTYTRDGLPPTPIAVPGKESLLAAARPAPSRVLFFVARGDGSSEFSETLEAHNRAVNKYQRGQ